MIKKKFRMVLVLHKWWSHNTDIYIFPEKCQNNLVLDLFWQDYIYKLQKICKGILYFFFWILCIFSTCRILSTYTVLIKDLLESHPYWGLSECQPMAPRTWNLGLYKRCVDLYWLRSFLTFTCCDHMEPDCGTWTYLGYGQTYRCSSNAAPF